MRINLNEALVPATLKDLKLAMKQDPELATFVKTKAKKLPYNYRFLVEELNPVYREKTLYDVMKTSLEHEQVVGSKTKLISKFSKTDDKITGFAAYLVNEYNEVTDMKMFSLTPESNLTLLLDLRKLLKDLTSKYDKVSWSALKENPANETYIKATEKYNVTIEEDGKELRYTIVK